MHPIIESFQWRSLSLVSQIAESRCLTKHNGIFGENNEELLANTLRDYLDSRWSIGSGEIIDVAGNRSPQCDIIVYNLAMLPRAYQNSVGKIVVPAHCVGAVVEVKTSVESAEGKTGTSAVSLWRQAEAISAFCDKALSSGNTRLLNRGHKDLHQMLSIQDNCIPVMAFAYSAEVNMETLHNGFMSANKNAAHSLDIYILDVMRSAQQIKDSFAKLGTNPGKTKIIELVNELRLPNGHSFHSELYELSENGNVSNQDPGVERKFHGAHCLRRFIKALSQSMNTLSPARYILTAEDREILYDAYHSWDSAS